VTVIFGGLRNTGLHVQVLLRSRSQLYLTAWALNGVPSENATPLRRVKTHVLPSLAAEMLVARSGIHLPPWPSWYSWPKMASM